MTTNAIESVKLLVVSQEPAVLRPVGSVGKLNCWHVETADNTWEAMERLESGHVPDLLLLALTRGDDDGLNVLRSFRALRPDLPIILISDTAESELAQEAIRVGADEVLVRPSEEQLEFAIRDSLDAVPPPHEIQAGSGDVEPLQDGTFFVGGSSAMRKLRAQTKLFAEAQVPLLIIGESGSGKSTAAQLIHEQSARSGERLLGVNCAVLPSHLLAEELFGYETRGDARSVEAHPGKFELCEKGTLLLEEIVEMPPDLQHKVLQVLESKQLVRLGGDKTTTVDVRVLATTSANIENAVAGKKLREDLYYCLSAFTLQVPPLRQRMEDLPLLLHHFMQHLARRYSLQPRAFSKTALEACQRYAWPGNLIELERFVKRYLVLRDREFILGHEPVGGTVVDVGYSFPEIATPAPEASDTRELGPDSLKSLVQTVKLEAEKNAIFAALQKTAWNRKAAARMLKVSYRTVLYKIDQYHLRPSHAAKLPDGHRFAQNINPLRRTER